MSTSYIAGFPRIGAKRELKFAIEKYWKGGLEEKDIFDVAKDIRQKNYLIQKNAGLNLLAAGDFTYYDHILDTQILLGAIPKRFGFDVNTLSLKEYFELARGNKDQPALEMTKWFDTNYHYIVPELEKDTKFTPVTTEFFRLVKEAQEFGDKVKPTIVGPLTFLWISKEKGEKFNKLDLLPSLIDTYLKILQELESNRLSWVQIDEPILALELPKKWIDAFKTVYTKLADNNIKILLGTYFDSVNDYISTLKNLPIDGIHIDCVRAPGQLNSFIKDWPITKVLSVGLIDGRNVWKADLSNIINTLLPVKEKFLDNLWISTSCSLLHSPQDLNIEEKIPEEIKIWLAFAVQKIDELVIIQKALDLGKDSVKKELEYSDKIALNRKNSKLIHKENVEKRVKELNTSSDKRKHDFEFRKKIQQKLFSLPKLPTTTIGSFPQTIDIRQVRAKFKKGEISFEEYEQAMKDDIAHMVKIQEELDIDVLVHGEPERNDMVEYFGEELSGFIFTQFGWVQSYGSRCVKPPIIYGDVSRDHPISVKWSAYAQSLTKKPMKGMLTGPVTILHWSFVRNDIPKSEICEQIAIALNDEILDLEKAGIKIIQIDEPAYREGLPLKKRDWDKYLAWASYCFRISSANVEDDTQIHTHMCYSEFNDILPAITAMDADVITIETSRSDMELLDAFTKYHYPNDIGPGVYDIHSPRVPEEKEVESLINKALKVIPAKRLWINPDCGLKTRNWEETIKSLRVMMNVTKKFRENL